MSDLKFGDLTTDADMCQKITSLHGSIQKIQETLDLVNKTDLYDTMCTKDKVDYDLFMAFALNTCYWMYLRTLGEDPNDNEVKNRFARIKEYMVSAKNAHERNTIRPTLNVPVAARFIKHGVRRAEDSTNRLPNKRIKFDD